MTYEPGDQLIFVDIDGTDVPVTFIETCDPDDAVWVVEHGVKERASASVVEFPDGLNRRVVHRHLRHE